MSTIETPQADVAEFKLHPPPGSSSHFTGTIVNNTPYELAYLDGRAENGWTDAPPQSIESGQSASFGNESDLNASGYVQYTAAVNGTTVTVTAGWSVPVIGKNSIHSYTDPSGLLDVQQSGHTSGWSPHVSWTVAVQ